MGRLVGWRVVGGNARFQEVTSLVSPVIGIGGDARVVAQWDCTSVDPGGVDIQVRDCPPFITSEIGSRGAVVVTFATGEVSLDAFLETFDVSGNVGEFLRGTARFRFSGA
jgi:hypothetical protein